MAVITLRKRTCIFCVSHHCDYTQRAIASIADVSQTSVPGLYGNMQKLVLLFRDARVNMEGNVKPRKKDEAILLRNSKKSPRKSSCGLQNDLAYSGLHLSSATVRHRQIEAGGKAKNTTKNQLLIRKWWKTDWRKQKSATLSLYKTAKNFYFLMNVIFLWRESRVDMSGSVSVKSLTLYHFNQVKHPLKKYSGVVSASVAWDHLFL